MRIPSTYMICHRQLSTNTWEQNKEFPIRQKNGTALMNDSVFVFLIYA